ncbi:MAG: type I-U CRISPR-associated protein Csx17, partial [Opitutaceae bacterium]
MPLHIHPLTGCAPAPLAHYLKALGILRLVAEQKDPSARGWWQNEAFHLATTLDHEQLEQFFLEEYKPTPIIAPWNKGAGFVFAANNPALGLIRQSTSPRMAPFRAAILQADQAITTMAEADNSIREIKGETKVKGMTKAEKDRLKNDPEYKSRLAEAERRFKQMKDGLIPNCRRTWRGPHLAWMDAAMVLNTDGEAKFPALLGSGGNDGKNDFTKQFMESLCTLFDWTTGLPTIMASSCLGVALTQRPASGSYADLPIGQFLPGSAGGANMTSGFDASAVVNPWDYILLLEGALLFIPALARRTSTKAPMAASAPFAIHGAPSGHASAARSEADSRGEQWMPLWNCPCTLPELKNLMGEGRAQLGKSAASRPVDFARAVPVLALPA